MNWFPLKNFTHYSLLKGFSKPHELAKLCAKHKYNIICLQETHINIASIEEKTGGETQVHIHLLHRGEQQRSGEMGKAKTRKRGRQKRKRQGQR